MKVQVLKDIIEAVNRIILPNNVRPITSLMQIEAKDGILTISSTDNITKVVAKAKTKDEIQPVVVNKSELLKLLKLLTVDFINIVVCDDHIKIKGNGNYKFPVQLNEYEEPITLKIDIGEIKDPVQIQKKVFADVRLYNEIALCKNEAHPQYCKYYSDETGTYTTDSITIAKFNAQMPQKEMLPYVLNCMCGIPAEDILYSVNDNIIRVDCERNDITYNVEIGIQGDEKPFPCEQVKKFVDDFLAENQIDNIPTKELIAAIKRLEIFNTSFNNPVVRIFIDKEGLHILNEDRTSEEIIPGTDIYTINSVVSIKIESVLNILKRMNDTVYIRFTRRAVLIGDKNVTYIHSVFYGGREK